MALTLYAGFDFARLGSFTMTCTGVSESITISSGTYAHVDLQAVMSSGSYDDFATALQTALNATGSSGWTVTFSTSTFVYTIANSSNFQITALSTVAANLLGITTLPTSSATSVDSQVRPYYVLSTFCGGISQTNPIYEPDGMAVDAEADNGTSYGFARATAPRYREFVIPCETQAAVEADYASTSVPWTHEHLFRHCRNIEPILFKDGSKDYVTKLREDGASYHPRYVTADYDEIQDVPYRVRILGKLI